MYDSFATVWGQIIKDEMRLMEIPWRHVFLWMFRICHIETMVPRNIYFIQIRSGAHYVAIFDIVEMSEHITCQYTSVENLLWR